MSLARRPGAGHDRRHAAASEDAFRSGRGARRPGAPAHRRPEWSAPPGAPGHGCARDTRRARAGACDARRTDRRRVGRRGRHRQRAVALHLDPSRAARRRPRQAAFHRDAVQARLPAAGTRGSGPGPADHRAAGGVTPTRGRRFEHATRIRLGSLDCRAALRQPGGGRDGRTRGGWAHRTLDRASCRRGVVAGHRANLVDGLQGRSQARLRHRGRARGRLRRRRVGAMRGQPDPGGRPLDRGPPRGAHLGAHVHARAARSLDAAGRNRPVHRRCGECPAAAGRGSPPGA